MQTTEEQIASVLRRRPRGMRIAQFISNATHAHDIYYMTNEQFLKCLRDYGKECQEAKETLTRGNT